MAEQGPKKILIVEDEAIIALSERMILQKHGYETFIAPSGEEAVAIATATPDLDLVLMDINLGPGIDGTEAAERILALRELPIVFLTAYTERSVVGRTDRVPSYGFIVKNSGETVLDASIKMAFRLFESRLKEREQAEALRESEAKFRRFLERVLESAPIGIAVNELDTGRVVVVNAGFEEAYGLSRDRLTDVESFFEEAYRDPATRAEIRKRILADIASGDPGRMRWENLALPQADGSLRYVTASNVPLPDLNVMVSTVQDVTEQLRIGEALRTSELKYRTLFETLPFGVTVTDDSGHIIESNREADRILGLSPEEQLRRSIDGKEWRIIRSDGSPMPAEEFASVRALQEGGVVKDVEMGLVEGRGDPLWISVTAAPLDIPGHGVVIVYGDITERRRTEEEVRRLLREKETTLREVHHRIKNNMATMMAILSIQAEKTGDGEARTLLRDASGRIQSMMLLYEKIYRTKGYDGISAADYLPALAGEIKAIFPEGSAVRLETEVEGIALPASVLSPLGILLYELVSNSMKHAFKGRKGGRIGLALESREGGASLRYEDDGPGIPPRTGGGNSTGFGLQLIQLLAAQLKGRLELEGGPGTRYSLVFPLGNSAEPPAS